jgi:hypothetical protein
VRGFLRQLEAVRGHWGHSRTFLTNGGR